MGDAPISDVVNVQITVQDQTVTQAGFGTPLILTNEAPLASWGAELVREYGSTTEVLEDWTSSDDVYLAAAAIFGQSPKVETVKVGLETARVAQVQTLTFSADLVAGNTVSSFTISFGGKTETVTATAFAVDHITTMQAVATKIQATNAITTAVVGGGGNRVITCTSAKAGVSFTVSAITVSGGASQATEVTATTVANSGIAESLAAISEEDDAWYGLIWNERDEDLVYTGAVYIETVRKIFVTCTSDVDVLDDTSTADIAAILSAANYTRTAIIWNADPSDFADAAWMGRLFPYDPGTETWALKELAGITTDSHTASERAAALDKNANIYVTRGGVGNTNNGTMASGRFIDATRFVDWAQARMEERIFSKLVNLTKVPFTDDGIAVVLNEVWGVIRNGVTIGAIAEDPEPTVTAPKAVDVSANDRANRLLPDVEFFFRYSGAIHSVDVNGTISV